MEMHPPRYILCAGAGGYASTRLFETDGTFLPEPQQTPEDVLAHWDEISDTSNQAVLDTAGKQTEKFLAKAMAHLESQSTANK